MGRVLLAFLSPCELEDYLSTTSRKPYTETTRVDADSLRSIVASVREAGWCLVDQELEEGLRSIAVPLSNRSGRVVAALNISAHASRVSLDRMVSELLPELKRAQHEIDVALRLQT
jgi:IclR family pca regulon transcriptional regulator